jgi:hypothetical protein
MSEPASNGNGAGVSYSVKELLAKIEGKLDGVIITIGQKADRHDVEQLDRRVSDLETSDRSDQAVRDFFRWLIPVMAVFGAAVAVHYLG